MTKLQIDTLGAPHLPTASGAAVMAIGIFALGALQQLPWPAAAATRPLGLVLVVLWAYMAASFVISPPHGTFHSHTADAVKSFAIGTWGAGTATVADVVTKALPGWRPLALALALITLLLWVWYLRVVAHGLRAMVADPARQRATGIILLPTVTTQSLVIVAYGLWPDDIPPGVAATLIALGVLFYGTGVMLIARRYYRESGRGLSDTWDNTNCIVHGAMSITGLAAVTSRAVSGVWIMASWLWAATAFALVESIEVVRLIARVRRYGWRRGVFTYSVSQWARNFTFGMFYAFTLSLHGAGAAGHLPSALTALQGFLLSGGPYVVAALLVIEVSLFVSGSRRYR